MRGANQFRVRFRGKKYGGVKYLNTYNTLAEAESACADFLGKIHNAGVGLDKIEKQHAERKRAGETTFGDLLKARQLEVVNKFDKGESHQYYSMLQVILKNSDLCDTPLSILEPYHFEQYIDDRIDEGVQGSTIRRELGMMSGIISSAMNRNYRNTFEFNPASQKIIEYPIDSAPRTRRMKEGEEEKIRTVLKDLNRGKHIALIFEIALTLGMRQAEIRQMEWGDVNFEKGYIYIPKTKTNRPRSVPLLGNLSDSLKQWKARNEKLAQRYGIDMPTWVFWNKDSGQVQCITKNAVNIMWRKVRKRAGIELPPIKAGTEEKAGNKGKSIPEGTEKANPGNLRFHDLRHEATSRLFEKHGLSIIEVMSVTGHRTTTMMERYTHLSAQKIGKKINEVGGKLELPISKEIVDYLNAESKRLKAPVEEVVTLLIQRSMRDQPASEK